MRPSIPVIRGASAFLICGLVFVLCGCNKGKSLDGVYHAGNGGSAYVITLKDGKATVNIGGEAKNFDYKVEGNQLTILDSQDGNIILTVNDDGTLTSPFGTFSKSKT